MVVELEWIFMVGVEVDWILMVGVKLEFGA